MFRPNYRISETIKQSVMILTTKGSAETQRHLHHINRLLLSSIQNIRQINEKPYRLRFPDKTNFSKTFQSDLLQLVASTVILFSFKIHCPKSKNYFPAFFLGESCLSVAASSDFRPALTDREKSPICLKLQQRTRGTRLRTGH